MPAEYDRLTRQYRRSKAMPFRVHSEIPDHLALSATRAAARCWTWPAARGSTPG
jgi:hypothetical protein